MNRFRYIFYIFTLAILCGCTDNLDILTGDDGEISAGDEVMFSAHVPLVATRSAKDNYVALINKYQHVQDDYTFDVEMWEKGDGEAVKIGQAAFNPTKNTVNDVTIYDEYGTLTEASDIMYWPSNVKKYGFHAVSSNSSETLEADQTDADRFFKQDRIEGYGYVPGWEGDAESGSQTNRVIGNFNFLTAKEWYAANKAWGVPTDKNGVPITDNTIITEYWKKIPLYMQHKRSRITVRLKAGEGIEREQIAYNQYTEDHISAEIYSYDGSNNKTVIKPLLGSYTCNYGATNQLPAEDVVTACYDAIVNPHDYADGTNITEQKILSINLSGQKFSFYAANDEKYSSETGADNADVETRYKLTEGKHLILDVVLSTDTRKILITAYVCPWEDWPFSSICDDFGQASDPMPINNKAELIEFLNNPDKNKAGNVGVIMPLNLNLIDAVYTKETAELENKQHLVADSNGKNPGEDGYVNTYEAGYTLVKEGNAIPGAAAGWNTGDFELKATLKLAGATITTDQCLFNKIAASGSIVNGSVVVADKDGDGALECAITKENYGTVERINVQKGNTVRKATRAGLVTTNYGTIYACSSQMPVYNAGGSEEVLIGGIAAEMRHPIIEDENGNKTPDLSVMPTIDQCNVNARIDGGSNVKGGGIAGLAEGKLSNNTYEYGITLSQEVERFKNILYAKGSQELSIYDNEWSTKAGNSVSNGTTLTNVRPDADLYNQVLDSQAELSTIITNGTYNNNTSRFRIADSFAVNGDTWTLGIQNLDKSDGRNLLCELNCNNKTITLTGEHYAKMLFSNIWSRVYDLTIVLDKPIEAEPQTGDNLAEVDRLPARAPLAYAVVGDKARISNITVKSNAGAYVKSTASGGLVVWAYDGATIEDCKSDVDVRIALPDGTGEQQTYFVGGLVCSAAKATILRCTYLRENLYETEEAHATNSSSIYYGGIVGGTNTKTEAVHYPELNISDCTSWLLWDTSNNDYPHSAWGGIIGYSKYQNSNSALVTSMDGKCQGNWWAAQYGASPKGWADGMTEEKVIGKKNSVQPQK